MVEQSAFIHPSAVVDEGAKIGADTKIWHFAHVMNTAKIGKQCIIGQNVFVGSNVVLGNNVKVQNNVSLYDGVICEEDVFLGPSCVFTNVLNPRSFVEQKDAFQPTIVQKGATVGANATIVCGNTIGQYALIGAGAVVTKDVANFALVIGNPARKIGWVSRKGHKLEFDKDGTAKCPLDGSNYIMKDGQVVPKEELES